MCRVVHSVSRPTSWLRMPLAESARRMASSGMEVHGCSYWEGRAEGLRDQRSRFPCGIVDFHVAVYSDAQLAAQNIDLLRLQRPEVLRNGVKSDTGA